MTAPIVVVDSQVHIWAAETPERPWTPTGALYAHRPGHPIGARDLLAEMAEVGVDRALLVPPSWEGDRNDLVTAAALDYPERFRWMGRVDLRNERLAPQLRRWKEQPGALGIRVHFASKGGSASWLSDGTADWVWPAAAAAHLPVMVFAPAQAAELERIAATYPDLRLIVDHLGIGADVRDVPLLPLIAPVLRLARYPNVAVKASALPCAVTEAYPFPSLHEPLRQVVETFGAERVFWGTDLSRLTCTYRQAVTLFVDELGYLSESDKRWIMGSGLMKWLDW